MEYKLLACDIDGTLLNDNLEISEYTKIAIQKSLDAGKVIVFLTGRNICQLNKYFDQFYGMKFAVTSSGATIYDIENDKRIWANDIEPEIVKWIIRASAGLDAFPYIFIENKIFCQTSYTNRCEEFGLGKYKDMFSKDLIKVENLFEYYMENPVPAEKFNMLFLDKNDKNYVHDQIIDLPISITTDSDYVMEINSAGVNKGRGLKKLCKLLNIGINETIFIGDSQNDISGIKSAGMGIAMGNSSQIIKNIADDIVPDNNSDGVATAIYKYLM